MKRAFTQPTDRAIAFSGLEKRLAYAFNSDAHYGIIDRFLHRGLLWMRKTNLTLTRTIPDGHVSQKDITPSWSWLAFEGNIEPMSISFESVAWSKNLHFRNDKELRCVVREFQDCDMVCEGDEYLLASNGGSDARSDSENAIDNNPYKPPPHRSWLRFDVGASDIGLLRCVVVGREMDSYGGEFGKNCYVIILKQSECEDVFVRVGAGCIHSRYISWDEPFTLASMV
jgi:hypothetical protein